LTKFVRFLFIAASTAGAQGTGWEQKIVTGNRLRELGQYVQAEAAFRDAVEEAELFRTPDARLATSLNGLADICQLRSQYDKAEQHYRRAIGVCWQ
jgi:tetratricopeptide (TPR) repeat protein